ncbi:disease resistance protein RGA1 [Canna indica]|uniref:Disease resistance protein RGA1 n=1 Tax=Canna indica TaxID=4628 RepID=A0AAQ3JPW5_9LILI|nr:disease resistance protein RGA1 [Canna indica]
MASWSVISSFLEWIGKLRSLTPSLPWSSSNQVNCVLEDLKILENMLKKIRIQMNAAEEREMNGRCDKMWLWELKDVAYDIEDVLDLVQYEVFRSQVEEGRVAPYQIDVNEVDEVHLLTLDSSILTEISIAVDMRSKVKEIKDKYDEISRGWEVLGLTEELEGKEEDRNILKKRQVDGTSRYGQTTGFMVKSEIYGRDSEKEDIIRWLFSDTSSKLSVIAIVGKGGLGKTTVAQLVYNDRRVSRYFDKVWIFVSANFDVARLTKEMVENNTMESCDSSYLGKLQATLKMKLKGRRLLLVLDDVWNDQRKLWDSFLAPLFDAEIVRIIVTTRNTSVANVMQTEEPVLLGYLPEKDSWQLFQHHAFNGRDPNVFPNLVEIGKTIVKRCGGLPLAVKSLGSLLQHETDEESWIDVSESKLWELDEKDILPALRISYSRMPNYLKPCFLYCSMFPKYHEFEKETLVALWMAQGYIKSRSDEIMEDIGSQYFDELQNRSFFDPKGLARYDRFLMHDNIHDLAQHISGDEGFAIVNRKLCDDLDRVRHLYVETNGEKLMESLVGKKLRPLRTIFMDYHERVLVENACLEFVLSMTSLRVLFLSFDKYDELPESIGNLKHLRYLHVYSHCMVRLHRSLGFLFNLQLLDLHCSKVKELPWDIGNLINLRHLNFTSDAIRSLPASICQLTKIQTLDLSGCTHLQILPESISRLSNLQNFGLKCCGVKELPSTIGDLHNLQYLDISGFWRTWLPIGIWKLNKLELLNTNIVDVRRECMPRGLGELEELVNLTALEIRGLNCINIGEAKGVNLRSRDRLKYLYLLWHQEVWEHREDNIERLRLNCDCDNRTLVDEETMTSVLQSLQPHYNLVELHIGGYNGTIYPSWIDDPSFNKLTCVVLNDCGNQKITCIPAFGQLPSLQQLSLTRVSHVRSIGSEFCHHISTANGASEDNKVAFPLLVSLVFQDLPEWEEWYGVTNGDFPKLRKLQLSKCPRLRMVPILPSKLEKLLVMDCLELSTLPGLLDLCQLEELNLCDCPKLKLPVPMTTKVRSVDISGCPKIGFLIGLQTVKYLEEIDVRGCAGLHLPTNCLSSTLRNLSFHGCLKPCVLPQLHNIKSLYMLKISGWPELQLPFNFLLPSKVGWVDIKDCHGSFLLSELHNLNYLQALHIDGCPELQLLPEETFLPSSLLEVKINNCTKLKCTLRFQNPSSLWSLTIIGCPQTHLSPTDPLPVKIKYLNIQDFPEITSLVGFQYLSCLTSLHISNWPQLQLPQDESLSKKLHKLHISNCPKLTSLMELHIGMTDRQKEIGNHRRIELNVGLVGARGRNYSVTSPPRRAIGARRVGVGIGRESGLSYG